MNSNLRQSGGRNPSGVAVSVESPGSTVGNIALQFYSMWGARKHERNGYYMDCNIAGVVELADTQDLKSCDSKGSCGFKSRLRHENLHAAVANRPFVCRQGYLSSVVRLRKLELPCLWSCAHRFHGWLLHALLLSLDSQFFHATL